jgi:hypothetical protein
VWEGQGADLVLNGQTRVTGGPGDATTFLRPTTLSVISLNVNNLDPLVTLTADRFGIHPNWFGPYHGWRGDLAELIVYDAPLSASDVKAVEHYLGSRYGIAIQ